MSDVKIEKDQMTQLFLQLVRDGYKLGVDEYLLGLQALKQGYGENEQIFLAMVEMLWGHSRSQQGQIKFTWENLQIEQPQLVQENAQDESKGKKNDRKQDKDSDQIVDESNVVTDLLEKTISNKSEISTIAIRTPTFSSVERDDLLFLKSYFPLSRRQMIYGWRFLRRVVDDGCKDVLDVAATIQATTDRGYYLAPVYRRRPRNAAKLLLIIDQNGSMMPFHRFTRDLVETAQGESPLAPENVSVFYFFNIPGTYLYRDIYLTDPILTSEILEQCDRDTSVLIVSDAGAARGYHRQERIQGTTRFLLRLRQRTDLVAWLNPLSRKRWTGSSAAILAYLLPMFQIDQQGFNDAIDVIRGAVLINRGEE
jgi:uncharacterized protein